MSDPLLAQEVLATLRRETPLAFWTEVTRRKRWAYGEAFAAVSNDARLLPNQKPAKLLDERFYLCERALHDAAINAGAVSSDQKIAINSWVYTFVKVGPISVIQTYIKSPADFARPARFREQHAALNDFLRRPQFALGDVSPEIFDIGGIAGVIVHGPTGRAFNQAAQTIGFLNFCVPSEDYRRWEVNPPVAEIMATFESGSDGTEQRDIATPKPRDRGIEKKDGRESA